jgi:hypothetical protein
LYKSLTTTPELVTYIYKFKAMPGTKNQNNTPKPPTTTQLPNVDNSQVIASKPNLVKENSSKIQTKVTSSNGQ